MVTFGVSTKSYQTATLNMVTLFFMIMTAFIEIIMPHLISTSYGSFTPCDDQSPDPIRIIRNPFISFFSLVASSKGLLPLFSRIY